MRATYTEITRQQFEGFLGVGPDGKPTKQFGYYRLELPNVYELVYGRRVSPDVTLRIFSSIDRDTGISRGKGKDAIRVTLFWKQTPTSEPRLIGVEKKVLRT